MFPQKWRYEELLYEEEKEPYFKDSFTNVNYYNIIPVTRILIKCRFLPNLA